MITVETVKEPPAIGKPEMCQGIRSEEGARKWASQHGYLKVYWYKTRERVYADKTTKSISQLALA